MRTCTPEPRTLRRGWAPSRALPAGLTLVRGAGRHREASEPRVRTHEALSPSSHVACLLRFEPAISPETLALQDLRMDMLHPRS